MRAGRDLAADFGQMQVHRLGVDSGQYESSPYPAGGADGAEQIGPVVTLVAGSARSAALGCPDVGQAALLADPGFILPPKLDRLAAGVFRDRRGD